MRRTIQGTIRHRLLVNMVVDPDEAAARLPEGLRPHATAAGTVVGCCLLWIDDIHPAGVPSPRGATLRAAAHRISTEWEDGPAGTTVGVYVPVRHTDSRLASTLGGRLFPGVHRRATIDATATPDQLRWTVTSVHDQATFGIDVLASVPQDAHAATGSNPIQAACVDAAVGLSPDHAGVLEGARMEPDSRAVCEVTIDRLDSAFLRGFTTAVPAPSYLMRDVGVTWTSAPVPVRAD